MVRNNDEKTPSMCMTLKKHHYNMRLPAEMNIRNTSDNATVMENQNMRH
jgi:hypothetical protein